MSSLETMEPTTPSTATETDAAVERHPVFDELRSEEELRSEWAKEDAAIAAAETDFSSPTTTEQETEEELEQVPPHIQDEINNTTNNLTQQQSASLKPTLPPATAHPVPPQEQNGAPEKDKPLTLVAIDQTVDAKKAAWASVDQRLSEEAQEGGKWKKIGRALWKNGVARRTTRRRYFNQAYNEIIEAQDVLLKTGAAPENRANAQHFLHERFKRVEDYFVAKGRGGEERDELSRDSPLAADLRNLVRDAAKNKNITDEQLEAAFRNILDDHRKAGSEELHGEGAVTSQNILEVVEQIRSADLHDEALDETVAAMRIISGEARGGSRTEVHYNKAERAAEWLAKKGGILGSISPELAGTGIAIATDAFMMSRGTLLRLSGLSIPGLTGYALGAFRAMQRRKEELVQHERDSEFGYVFRASDERRKELEALSYDKKYAPDLTAAITNTASKEMLDEGGEEALKAALAALAEATMRQSFYNRGKAVLSWTDEAKKYEEEYNLYAARIAASNRIAEKIDTLDPDARNRLIDDEARDRIDFSDNPSFQDILNAACIPQMEQLEGHIEEQDKAKKRWTRKAMLGREAFMSAGISVAGSALAMGIGSAFETTHTTGGGALVDQGNNLKINGGYDIQSNMDGTLDIKGPDGNIVMDHVLRDPNGKLPQASLDQLQGAGFTVTEHEIPPVFVDKQLSLQEYLNAHSGETVHVSQTEWLGNGTGYSDGNELQSDWTGNGVGPNGEVLMNIQGMDGYSWNGTDYESPQAAMQSGDMKLYVSFDEATKDNPIAISYDTNGNLVIPPDSPAAKAFWSDENGHMQFHGYEAKTGIEVQNGDGTVTVKSFATVVGENNMPPTITDHVPEGVAHYDYELTAPEHIETTGGLPGGFVWTVGREDLTPAARIERPKQQPRPDTEDYYKPSYESMTKAERKKLESDRMPELRENPGAKVELKEALAWHERLTKQKDAYYAAEIEKAVETTPELARLDRQTKAIVTIPVGAKFEADNIHRTLMLYAKQGEEAMKDTLILLHVNWVDADANDENVIKTRKMIEKAKRDFPGLRIGVIESEWSKAKIDDGEYGDRLIGHVSQKMYDAAFEAVRRAIDEGRMEADSDVLVIKNDADALGMDRRYLSKMIRAFEEHPENDTYTGGVRWGTNRHGDLPGLGFVTNFMEMSRIAVKLERVGGFQTSFGVNAAVRMSTFAAVGGIGHYTNQKQSAPDDLAINDRVAAARMALSPHAPQSGGYGATPQRPGSHDYHRHVVGATIDTDASRMEKVYVEGKPITSIWYNVNDGGWVGRTAGLEKGKFEDLKKDSSAVMDRIEMNMGELISRWVTNETQVRATLAFMLPGPDQLGGKPAYRLERKNGRTEFYFTPQGKRWVVNRLQRSAPKGKLELDSYGGRVARQLYGRMVKGARIQPKNRTPRMVGGIENKSSA